MFSVATTTALLFVVFLMILGVTIWMDSKKIYIIPPKLNHEDGGQECGEGGAIAEYKTNTKNGDVIVNLTAPGGTSAKAWAELGYEYENSNSEDEKLVVELAFKYRIQLKTDTSNSPVSGKIETLLNSDAAVIKKESLSAPPAEESKNSDGFISSKQRHIVDLKAGENFTAVLKVSLEGEGKEGGECSGEIIANVSEIYYRPELRPF